MPALLLVRYGELALKSPPVRREFERTLGRNILAQFASVPMACRIRTDHGHLYVESEDPGRAATLVRRVFGVTSVSVVHEGPSTLEAIVATTLPLLADRLAKGTRFAVRARRTGQHPFTSQELARDLGGRILDAFPSLGLRVDLTHPEVEVFVEVRGPRSYVSFERVPGPGGLPLGVAGRLVAYVDGPRGALGAWLMMKRGCRCHLIATGTGGPLAEEVLRRFDPNGDAVEIVGPTEVDPAMRRAAESGHVDGIVLPLDVIAFPDARRSWGDRVVFSPTVGLEDEEVEERWRHVVALVSS